jgi:uncharacterized membrane protein
MPGSTIPLDRLTRWLPSNRLSFAADFLLSGMVVGPVVAPFLASSQFLMLPIVANIIYFMGQHVCPQPEMGVMMASPFIMAVCMRCYGTVMGLFLTRLLYAFDPGKAPYWLHQYGWPGTLVTAGLMMAYPIELLLQSLGVWNYDNTIVTIFGLITGLAWGLHGMPILHGDYTMKPASPRS